MRRIMHGNNTDTRTDGSPPPFGGTIVVAGQGNRRGGKGSWGRQVIGIPVECDVEERRFERATGQEGSWHGAPFKGEAKRATGANFIARSSQIRIPERLVDLPAGCASDRTGFRSEVSPRPRVEDSSPTRLDVPEARAASARERRRGRPALAEARLAAHKKGASEELALLSSTKAVLCSNPRVVALGHRVVKRRSSEPGTVTIVCRSLGPSRCLLAAITSVSISRFLTETWMQWTWSGSLNRCIAVYRGRSFLFGTERVPIAELPSCFSPSTPIGSPSNGCHPIARSLILRSSVGNMPSMMTSQTSSPMTSTNSTRPSVPRFNSNATIPDYFVPISSMPSSGCDSFHNQYRTQ